MINLIINFKILLAIWKKTSKAVDLFVVRYGKKPQEFGFSAIDIYEKQQAFLYAVSEKVIKSYKTQQNILRWTMKWLVVLPTCALMGILLFNQDITMTIMAIAMLYYAAMLLATIVFCIIAKYAMPPIKLGKTIVYLNY